MPAEQSITAATKAQEGKKLSRDIRKYLDGFNLYPASCSTQRVARPKFNNDRLAKQIKQYLDDFNLYPASCPK